MKDTMTSAENRDALEDAIQRVERKLEVWRLRAKAGRNAQVRPDEIAELRDLVWAVGRLSGVRGEAHAGERGGGEACGS